MNCIIMCVHRKNSVEMCNSQTILLLQLFSCDDESSMLRNFPHTALFPAFTTLSKRMVGRAQVHCTVRLNGCRWRQVDRQLTTSLPFPFRACRLRTVSRFNYLSTREKDAWDSWQFPLPGSFVGQGRITEMRKQLKNAKLNAVLILMGSRELSEHVDY